jgi:ADP-heptose:LPS heptosyltransferase
MSKVSTMARLRIRMRWKIAQAFLHNRANRNARRFAVGVVKVDRLGDFVLATTAIRLLTERYGPDKCLLVISPFAREIAQREFPETPQIVVPPFVPKKLRKIIPLWKKFRHEFSGIHCEQIVSLRHNPALYRDTLLNWIPAERRHGLAGPFPLGEFSGGDYPFSKRIPFPTAASANSCLDLEAHRLVVSQALGREVAIDEIKPRLHSIPTKTSDYLFVAPFGSEPIRDYPTAQLLNALKQIQQQYACPIQVLAGPDQGARLRDFQNQAQAIGLTFASCAAGAKLDAYLAAIGEARAVVTMESASAHIAAALDKPTVTLLGGGHFGLFSPWQQSSKQRWLSHSMDCFGCNWTCRHPENFCLSRIQPKEIVSALRDVAFASL